MLCRLLITVNYLQFLYINYCHNFIKMVQALQIELAFNMFSLAFNMRNLDFNALRLTLLTYASIFEEGGCEFFLFCLTDELLNRVSVELGSSENHGGASSCCREVVNQWLQRSREPLSSPWYVKFFPEILLVLYLEEMMGCWADPHIYQYTGLGNQKDATGWYTNTNKH